MPPRPKVHSLPSEVKESLDAKLMSSGFSDYEGLSEWLAEQGFEISSSALGRYGKGFEAQVRDLRIAAEQARVAVEAIGDDEDALGEAMTGMMKQKLMSTLVDFQIDTEALTLKELTLAISRVSNAGVRVKQYAAQARERARMVAAEVTDVVRAAGLSDEAAELINQKILGVAP